ncbi:MAG: aminoacetone oxidase family FAD-binding enzyme, partial [Clostridia bacterium]|nr:aminoacetone oxidase family FAD-binding enzyme [Clostridia bacterium]
MKTEIAVIGGGASGMLAALAASDSPDCRVTVFEKNTILGKKLLVTGKGRCNVTNDCDPREFSRNVVRGSKFLTSALFRFSPARTMELLESLGVGLKTERGRRVFPVSDRAEDVRCALENAVRSKENVRIINKKVDGVKKSQNGFSVCFSGREEQFCKVILATGGLSYPKTGSTGDGYKFARALGHKITPLSASLTALVCREEDCAELEGLSLKNVSLTLLKDQKTLYKEQGEMLFTDRGVSGPLVLSASANLPADGKADLLIDFKPALSEEELDRRLIGDF